jgi:probable aminopeptidase NPEPL1
VPHFNLKFSTKKSCFQGEDLKEKGFGGIYGVGKAAEHKPALVVLSHTPEAATRTVAWVGKGIVYDTGGLSIKVNKGHLRTTIRHWWYL